MNACCAGWPLATLASLMLAGGCAGANGPPPAAPVVESGRESAPSAPASAAPEGAAGATPEDEEPEDEEPEDEEPEDEEPEDEEPEDEEEAWAREAAEAERRRAERVEALRQAIGARAPELVERVAELGDEYGSWTVEEENGLFVVRIDEWGNGIYGAWSSETHVLSAAGPILTLSLAGLDGAYVSSVRVDPNPRSSEQRAALRAAAATQGLLLESAQGSDAARAQLFLSVRRRPRATPVGDATVVGPLYLPSRPVLGPPPGRACGDEAEDPTGLPALVLRPSVLGVRGLAVPAWSDEGGDDEEEGQDGEEDQEAGEAERSGGAELAWVAGVEGCATVSRQGAVELRAYQMRGRNRGVTVALFDPRAGRHRWILETRNAVLGSDVRWLGAHRGVVLGTYRANHPGELYAGHAGILAVRVRDGAVFRIDVAGAFEGGRRIEARHQERELAEQTSACLEERARALGSDPLPREEIERCHAQPHDVELTARALRVRRADGSWSELPLSSLTARIARLR